MKAWYVFTDGGILLHAETRNKARVLGAAEMSAEYIDTGVRRVKELDDRPIICADVSAVFGEYNADDWFNSCGCELCAGAK